MTRRILRTCVGCRTVRDQGDLVRLSIDPIEGLTVRPGRIRGRGAYLCPALACFAKAWQRKALARAFRGRMPAVDASVFQERFATELNRRKAREIAARSREKERGRYHEEGRAERRTEESLDRKSPGA